MIIVFEGVLSYLASPYHEITFFCQHPQLLMVMFLNKYIQYNVFMSYLFMAQNNHKEFQHRFL